jgi:hypothetical protein
MQRDACLDSLAAVLERFNPKERNIHTMLANVYDELSEARPT